MRTKPAPTYITPNADEIRAAAEKVGLKAYSVQLAQDIANIASGGQVLPPSAYRSTVKAQIEQTVQGNEYNTKAYLVEVALKQKMQYNQNVCDFLQTLKLQSAIGSTPLEKAVSTLKLLSQQGGGSGNEDGGNSLPIFSDSDAAPEKAAKKIEEQIEVIETLSNDEKEFIDENDSLSAQNSNPLAKLKVAEDMKEGGLKRTMLEVSRVLDTFTRLQVSKQTRFVADPEGEQYIDRPMKNLAELSLVGGQDWAIYKANKALFMYQAATGAMPVRERVTQEDRKQAIFILVDGSGSMNGTRHYKATGVVMNRLKAAIKGDAVVYISVFDTAMSEPDKAETPEAAKELAKKFADGNYRGGGTDIAMAVKQAHDFIQKQLSEGAMIYRPEIVVLTDDDDSAKKIKASQIPGTKVHGFAMDSSNSTLKSFVESTGGLYFHNF